jgi:hypothetical protein
MRLIRLKSEALGDVVSDSSLMLRGFAGQATLCPATITQQYAVVYLGHSCCCVPPAGCGKGYQWPDQGQGWDIAALSDQHPEYRGSCGGCYEVKCDSSHVRDGYGEPGSREQLFCCLA